MFKNMIKRSWLSTIRKPSRGIILVAILFVMANMMLATIAIRNSVDVSVQAAKEKMGSVVYLTTDTEKLQEQMQSMRSSGSSGMSNITMPTISEGLAKSIGESEYLTAATYSISITANASNYTAVETVQNQREREMQEQFQNMRDQVESAESEYNAARDQYNSQSTGGAGMPGGGMARPNFTFSMNLNISDPTLSGGDTTIQGIDNFSFVSEVEAGTVSLVDGKVYDPQSENAVIVSQQLLDDNSLSTGDSIKLKTVSDETEITLTIVGTYKSTALDENGEDSFNNNTIYMSLATAKKFMTSEQLENLTVSSVKYYLAQAEEKDAFLAWADDGFAEKLDGLKLDIDDTSYQTMVGPIENVGSFAGAVMWIVIIAAVTIITLIVIINVKDRRYEMGVLLSLGAKRGSILGQIFLELVIVGTVGFVLSLGTGQLIASYMGESLLAQQVASSEAESADETTMGPGGGGAIRRFGQQNLSGANVKAIDEIDVSAGIQEYLTLFGAGYLILIVAMILPSANILRYQPKTILTGKE
ncbi:ABC transporter permease [Candidatus Saccharibacteria bacterium]|nr:ABC transporter permease [Candidatus Saccharibacteria bacterium]